MHIKVLTPAALASALLLGACGGHARKAETTDTSVQQSHDQAHLQGRQETAIFTKASLAQQGPMNWIFRDQLNAYRVSIVEAQAYLEEKSELKLYVNGRGSNDTPLPLGSIDLGKNLYVQPNFAKRSEYLAPILVATYEGEVVVGKAMVRMANVFQDGARQRRQILTGDVLLCEQEYAEVCQLDLTFASQQSFGQIDLNSIETIADANYKVSAKLSLLSNGETIAEGSSGDLSN